MRDFIFRFVTDESGATAMEYGLIVAGISLAIVTAVNTLATSISANFAALVAVL